MTKKELVDHLKSTIGYIPFGRELLDMYEDHEILPNGVIETYIKDTDLSGQYYIKNSKELMEAFNGK